MTYDKDKAEAFLRGEEVTFDGLNVDGLKDGDDNYIDVRPNPPGIVPNDIKDLVAEVSKYLAEESCYFLLCERLFRMASGCRRLHQAMKRGLIKVPDSDKPLIRDMRKLYDKLSKESQITLADLLFLDFCRVGHQGKNTSRFKKWESDHILITIAELIAICQPLLPNMNISARKGWRDEEVDYRDSSSDYPTRERKPGPFQQFAASILVMIHGGELSFWMDRLPDYLTKLKENKDYTHLFMG